MSGSFILFFYFVVETLFLETIEQLLYLKWVYGIGNVVVWIDNNGQQGYSSAGASSPEPSSSAGAAP